MVRPGRREDITRHAGIDPTRCHRGIGGAVPAPRAWRQAQIRDPADRDRRAQPVDQIKQRIRPRGETVVHLTPEPVKFTLVRPPTSGRT
jgi:hypothetical protein